MIIKFEIFENWDLNDIPSGLTSKQFSREFYKKKNASVDKDIPSKPGRFYWKIHRDSLGIIEASLNKIGSPKILFYDIKNYVKSDLLSLSNLSDLEIWYTKDWRETGKDTWMHSEWDWAIWEADKKLKGYKDARYLQGYKYMGVVNFSKEERDMIRNAEKYNL